MCCAGCVLPAQVSAYIFRDFVSPYTLWSKVVLRDRNVSKPQGTDTQQNSVSKFVIVPLESAAFTREALLSSPLFPTLHKPPSMLHYQRNTSATKFLKNDETPRNPVENIIPSYMHWSSWVEFVGAKFQHFESIPIFLNNFLKKRICCIKLHGDHFQAGP